MFTVIIGSNRGIGLELTKQFKSKGHSVLAVCRNSSKELESVGCEILKGIDVSKDSDLLTLKNHLRGQKIDLLVHNAGIMRRNSLNFLNVKTIEEQFQVNTLGPLKTVSILLSNLGDETKIALITSRMGSIADNTSGGSYGYRISKCALNMAGVSLAHDLRPKNISVALIHPGWVKTDMTNQTGLIDTKTSANGIINVIENLNIKNSGSFWHTNGEELIW